MSLNPEDLYVHISFRLADFTLVSKAMLPTVPAPYHRIEHNGATYVVLDHPTWVLETRDGDYYDHARVKVERVPDNGL